MKEWFSNLVTGKDNKTHDIGRWSWVIGLISVISIAIYQVLDHSIVSLRELAEALGIVSGANGIAIMAKKDTEPTGDEK
jgi:hypothetical protein